MNHRASDPARTALKRLDRSIRERLGIEPAPDDLGTEMLFSTSDETVAAALAHLERAPGDTAELSAAIIDLLEAQLRLRRKTTTRTALESKTLAGAIRRVAAQPSAAAVAHQACVELVTVGDFKTAAISEVHDDHFIVIASAGATTRRNEQIARRGADLENKCIQQKTQVVSDEAPATNSFADLLGTTDYMSAPIIFGDTVPALIHVGWPDSRSGAGDDPADRQLLDLFADAVGVAYSREINHYQAARRHRALVARTATMLNETAQLLNTDLTLAEPIDNAVSGPADAPADYASLTPRETEVMEMIADGATNAEIAERLFISIETVKSHVKKILRKTGSINRSEAIARYLGQQ